MYIWGFSCLSTIIIIYFQTASSLCASCKIEFFSRTENNMRKEKTVQNFELLTRLKIDFSGSNTQHIQNNETIPNLYWFRYMYIFFSIILCGNIQVKDMKYWCSNECLSESFHPYGIDLISKYKIKWNLYKTFFFSNYSTYFWLVYYWSRWSYIKLLIMYKIFHYRGNLCIEVIHVFKRNQQQRCL